jgi:hypothetical protein
MLNTTPSGTLEERIAQVALAQLHGYGPLVLSRSDSPLHRPHYEQNGRHGIADRLRRRLVRAQRGAKGAAAAPEACATC